MKDNFCSHCGVKYDTLIWPRMCNHCHEGTWRNPQPVGVSIVPLKQGNEIGLLLVRRAIPPIGGLAMPGGFMDYHETWEQTCSRELEEETGIKIPERSFTFFDIKSSAKNGKILIFGLAPVQNMSVMDSFAPNEEVSELVVIYSETELCFPLQTEVSNKWFKEQV